MGPSGSGSIPPGLNYNPMHLDAAMNKISVSTSEDSWLRYKRARFLKKLCSYLISTDVYHEETYLRVESVGLYFMQLYFVHKPQLQMDGQKCHIPCLACLFLACKVNDVVKKMRDMIKAYGSYLSHAEGRELTGQEAEQIRENVCVAEAFLIKSIAFNFDVQLPLDYISVYFKVFEAPPGDTNAEYVFLLFF